MKLKTVLLRLGSEKLIKLIDDDFFKILKLRNKILINQKYLKNPGLTQDLKIIWLTIKRLFK